MGDDRRGKVIGIAELFEMFGYRALVVALEVEPSLEQPVDVWRLEEKMRDADGYDLLIWNAFADSEEAQPVQFGSLVIGSVRWRIADGEPYVTLSCCFEDGRIVGFMTIEDVLAATAIPMQGD